MLKTARIRARKAQFQKASQEPCEDAFQREAGKELRQYLLEKFCIEGMPGSEVATLSRLITRAGGVGVENLALPPESAVKNGQRHVKKNAGTIYPEVDLTYVNCPLHQKRESQRRVSQVPIYLPSSALAKYITKEMIENTSEKQLSNTVGGVSAYNNHPLVHSAKLMGYGKVVRPLALYWDGVVYTKNDTFFAFYVTDMLSSQKFLSFLLRVRAPF